MIGWCIFISLVTFILWISFYYKINYVRGLKENVTLNDRIHLQNRQMGDLPPIYPNGWFCILESSQLKKGEVKYITALGENFAVFRTKTGKVSVLDAYCPHLGANMAKGGTVLDDGCLECPFHQWKFRGDGQCIDIPYTKSALPSIKTKSWICCEVNAAIFVWYHAENIKPDWYIEPVEEISTGKWGYHGRNEFLINCHIQEIAENGADWPHLNSIHGHGLGISAITPHLLNHVWSNANWRPGRRSKDIENNYEDTQIGIKSTDSGVNNRKSSVNDKHLASVTLRHQLLIAKRYLFFTLDVQAEQIGPSYVKLHLDTALGRTFIIQSVTPIKPLIQCVRHLLFSPFIISPLSRIIFLSESIMFERDIAVWNYKKYLKNPRLVREDKLVLAYRRWYSQFYSPSSPTYSNTIKSLDW